MTAQVRLSKEALIEAAKPALRRIAEGVATTASRRTRDHKYAESIQVAEIEGGGFRVYSQYPFAHLDEYGSINNLPTGAMRSAADETGGRYEPT